MSIRRGFQAAVGATCPSFQLQLTPLHWELAFSWGPGSVALKVGPVGVRLDVAGFHPELRFGWFDLRLGKYRDNARYEYGKWTK
jgi:hypothetical protein